MEEYIKLTGREVTHKILFDTDYPTLYYYDKNDSAYHPATSVMEFEIPSTGDVAYLVKAPLTNVGEEIIYRQFVEFEIYEKVENPYREYSWLTATEKERLELFWLIGRGVILKKKLGKDNLKEKDFCTIDFFKICKDGSVWFNLKGRGLISAKTLLEEYVFPDGTRCGFKEKEDDV